MADEVTALIADTIGRYDSAGNVAGEARAIRDALSAAGWLNDSEEQVVARYVLDMDDVRRMLRDKVARMVAAEREKHVANGRAEERRLWLEGKSGG